MYTARFNVELQIEHIPGRLNELADELSRAHTNTRIMSAVLAKAKKCNAISVNITDDLFEF